MPLQKKCLKANQLGQKNNNRSIIWSPAGITWTDLSSCTMLQNLNQGSLHMPVCWPQASRLLDCSLQGYDEPREWTVLTIFNTLWTYDYIIINVKKKQMQTSSKIKILFPYNPCLWIFFQKNWLCRRALTSITWSFLHTFLWGKVFNQKH